MSVRTSTTAATRARSKNSCGTGTPRREGWRALAPSFAGASAGHDHQDDPHEQKEHEQDCAPDPPGVLQVREERTRPTRQRAAFTERVGSAVSTECVNVLRGHVAIVLSRRTPRHVGVLMAGMGSAPKPTEQRRRQLPSGAAQVGRHTYHRPPIAILPAALRESDPEGNSVRGRRSLRTTHPGPPWGEEQRWGERDGPGTSLSSVWRDLSMRRPYRRAWKGRIRMGACPKMPTANCCGCKHGLPAQQIGVSRER
jgi:hypothetical protein